jgi:BNR/Asp-box repeat
VFAASGMDLFELAPDADGLVAEKVLEGVGAQCVAVAPGDPAVVYCGCHGGGLWVSRDGGGFQRSPLPQEDVFSVAVSAADGAVYAGCEPSRLYRSRDGGESWQELSALLEIPSAPTWSFPPRPWTSHVRWIAPSPHEADLLLVGIELGGVMLSEDAGASFSDHRPGAVRDVHCVAWHPTEPGRGYEAGGGGAAWSSDSGRTWQRVDEGRDRHYVWALAVDPRDPERWFVSASPGPFEAHGRGSAQALIYRFEDGVWRPLAGGLPEPIDSLPYALRIEDGSLYAGLGDGRVYASADGGDSWRAMPVEGAPPERIVALG